MSYILTNYYYLFKSLLATISFILNFTLLISLWRIVELRIPFFKVRVKMIYMFSPHWYQIIHLSTLLNVLSLIVGIVDSIIHTLVLFIKFCLRINCLTLHQCFHHLCSACQMGKSSRLSLVLKNNYSHNFLELVFSDVRGPVPIPSISGYRYFVIFKEIFSKHIWFYPMVCKSEVFDIFPKFLALVEHQFSTKLKYI